MSDLISGPPKTVQQLHNLRTVRQVNLNEQRDDEKRHLAELEEHMREVKRRKQQEEEGQKQEPSEEEVRRGRRRDVAGGQARQPAPEQTAETEDGHIDFTA